VGGIILAGVSVTIKKRILFVLISFFLMFFVLIGRLIFIQIINGDDYLKKAVDQWTKDIAIPSKRGIIYDRNGKKMAVSATAYILYARPVQIKDKVAMAKILSEVLKMDEQTVLKKISDNKSNVLIKQKVDSEKVNELREKLLANKLNGIEFVDDCKRFYPQANFASHLLGFTNNDNTGQDGVEAAFDKYLNGFPGRNIVMTDGHGDELPGSDRKYFEPQDGLNLVLSVDEVIQHFAEKAIENAQIENKAKRAMAIVMDPKTGDILAMVAKSDYDNNEPRKAPANVADRWPTMKDKEQLDELYKVWRNPILSDSYEPGSTFKIITSAAGLEENVVNPDDRFYCSGFVTVGGHRLKCWRSYRPHGSETFTQGVQNSCNPVFIEVGQRLGKEKFVKYIKAFGFGAPTNVNLPGEASGIVRDVSAVGPVELANIAFGQGITVTPIQLITAVSAVANGGYLMEPRIAKKLVDNDGNAVHEFEPRVVRQVISKETSEVLRGILASVVSDGTGRGAMVPGFKVAGKTGTAQKAENGRYVSGKFVASFVGFAPANDPKVAVLVVIDEPNGSSTFGGVIAAPVVGSIIGDTLRYLDVKPQYTEEEAKKFERPIVKVPEIRNMKYKEAVKELTKLKLQYRLDDDNNPTTESLVLDQTPRAGAEVNEGTIVILYAQNVAP